MKKLICHHPDPFWSCINYQRNNGIHYYYIFKLSKQLLCK